MVIYIENRCRRDGAVLYRRFVADADYAAGELSVYGLCAFEAAAAYHGVVGQTGNAAVVSGVVAIYRRIAAGFDDYGLAVGAELAADLYVLNGGTQAGAGHAAGKDMLAVHVCLFEIEVADGRVLQISEESGRGRFRIPYPQSLDAQPVAIEVTLEWKCSAFAYWFEVPG